MGIAWGQGGFQGRVGVEVWVRWAPGIAVGSRAKLGVRFLDNYRDHDNKKPSRVFRLARPNNAANRFPCSNPETSPKIHDSSPE